MINPLYRIYKTLDNSSETYDNSDASLKSPCKTKRSARSKIQPKLLPTVRNKNQLSKNDLSFTSNKSTSNTDDVHEKVSPDEEQRQRNNVHSKISKKTKGEETSTDKTLFKCSFCSFASYFKASYTLHSKKHHKTEDNKDLFLMCKKRKNVYTCTVCKKSFNSSGNMFRHMKLHRDSSLYQCMVCKVTLDSSETLKNHIADVHMGSLKFVKT
ncbi:hypothetical protein Avbf_12554 [Armadillidium vulgare]|nr:hypothetical protein Avbf_12554 [Armadillidium vulgare]